jgi:hypothetical protein
VSVAVYIEFPQATHEATLCRQRVTSYLSNSVLATGWPPNAQVPPMVVSFLHATKATPEASCDVPGMSDEATHDEIADGDVATHVQMPDNGAASDDDGDGHDGDSEDEVSGGDLGSDGDGDRDGDERVLIAGHASRFGGPFVPQYIANRFRSGRPRSRLLHGSEQGGLPEGGLGVSGSSGAGGGVRSVSDDIAVPGLKRIWRVQPQVRGKLPLVTEQPWREVYAGFYPVNSLRNLAWAQVSCLLHIFVWPRLRVMHTPHAVLRHAACPLLVHCWDCFPHHTSQPWSELLTRPLPLTLPPTRVVAAARSSTVMACKYANNASLRSGRCFSGRVQPWRVDFIVCDAH